MQIGNGDIHFRRTSPGGEDENSDDESEDNGGQQESIRDLQRRRRNASRVKAGMEAILARPQDEDEDEEPASGPVPARVFVVFRGAKWSDPDGALRESDSIAGVYSTEVAAKKAADALSKAGTEQDDAWYQPYPVQE